MERELEHWMGELVAMLIGTILMGIGQRATWDRVMFPMEELSMEHVPGC